jgi:hypothetical protein
MEVFVLLFTTLNDMQLTDTKNIIL